MTRSRAVLWTVRVLLASVVSLALAVLVLAGWALTTTSGAQWIGERVVEADERIALSVRGGSILTGLSLADVHWRDEGVDVYVERMEARWRLECLLRRTVCLDSVRVDRPRVQIATDRMPDNDAEPRPAAARLDLPVNIELGGLSVTDVRVQVDELTVTVQHVTGRGQFADAHLQLDEGYVRGITVRVPSAAPEAEPAADESAPIELPDIRLPLDIDLASFRVERVLVQRDEARWALPRISIIGGLHDSRLDIASLELEYESYALRGAGWAELSGDYPLSFEGRLRAPDLFPSADDELQFSLDDRLRRLGVQAQLVGSMSAELVATLEPLDPQLPFAVDLEWADLTWPLDGAPMLESPAGRVQASGSLEQYRARAELIVQGEQIPTGAWSATVGGDLGSVAIERLEGAVLDGRVVARGHVSWRDEMFWQADAALVDIDPGSHWAQYPGEISGSVAAEGRLRDGAWSLRTVVDGIAGTITGRPFQLSGQLARELDASWRIDRFRLDSGENRVQVAGTVDTEWNMQGELDAPDLAALLLDADGSLAGRLAVSGDFDTPSVRLQLRGESLHWRDYAARELAVAIDLAEWGQTSSQMDWTLAGIQIGDRRVPRLSGALRGSLTDHRLAIEAVALDPRERALAAAMSVRGTYDDDAWRGVLNSAELALPGQAWRLLEPASLSWNVNAAAGTIAAHCWGFQDARLCLNDAAEVGAQAGNLTFSLADYRLEWLASYLPAGLFWDAPFDADGALRWAQGETPEIELEAVSANGEVLLSQVDAAALRLGYRRLAIAASLSQSGLEGRVLLESDTLGEIDVDVAVRPEEEGYRLGGDVALEGFQLTLFQPFFPQLRSMAGEISAAGALSGTLADPRFDGTVTLRDGALSSPELPVQLSDIGLRLTVTGSAATLAGAFRSGDGQGTLEGEFDWSDLDDWRADVRLQGDELEVVYQPLAQLQVSPELRVIAIPGAVRVEGLVFVPSGTVTLQTLPAQAVPVSDDVEVVRRPGGVSDAELREAAEMPWRLSIDLQIGLGQNIAVSGYGVQGRLAGALRVRQEADGVPEAFGDIRIEDGRYEAYGQRLVIRQGRLVFAGPVTQPDLNIEAVRVVDDVQAGIRIVGQPDQPQAELFSEPAMPPEDVLSYIVRGRPLDEAGAGRDAALTQAMLALGALGGQEFTAGIAEQLGVEDFAVDVAGEGDEAQVLVSGYINPRLFLQYGVGVFEPAQQLTVRYRLSPRIHVEALRGVENALDFFYTFEF